MRRPGNANHCMIMRLIVRQKGSRRWKLPDEFPLLGCQGVAVIQDRRRLPDRRKAGHGIEDLNAMRSEMGDH